MNWLVVMLHLMSVKRLGIVRLARWRGEDLEDREGNAEEGGEMVWEVVGWA